MNAPSPKITYGTPRVRAPRGPARIRRRWGGGIFWREVRAAFPTIAALAGLMALFAFIAVIGEHLREQYRRGDMLYGCEMVRKIWYLTALITALIMGVLCGAEEAENGTADFTRRLPVTRLRIYAAKTCGALFAVALWFILAGILVDLVYLFGLVRLATIDPTREMIYPFFEWRELAVFCLFLFFCGQAAGAWTERVLVGAVIGGAVGLSCVFSAFAFQRPHQVTGLIVALCFLAATLLALLAAYYRFQTREGR